MSIDDQKPSDRPEQEELPDWLRQSLKTVQAMPAMAARLPTWLPTIAAAWRASAAAIALTTALKDELRQDGQINWPDELVAELMLTLGELFDALPTLDEALPTAADLLDLATEAAQGQRAQSFIEESLTIIESTAQRVLGRLLEVAFFSPATRPRPQRASHLLHLFTRLEELLDRLLNIWITRDPSKGASS